MLLRIPAGPVEGPVHRDRGSRFVARVAPARSERGALDVVEAVRAEHGDATHVVWALRLADGLERSSDDGEPAGTSGPPVLRRLEAADLVDVVCTVTRWYGGTNLGRGGLVRAYGAAATAALELLEVHERSPVVVLLVDHPYELTAAVEATVAAHGARVVNADHGARVRRRVAVPSDAAGAFTAALRDATAGRVRAEPT